MVKNKNLDKAVDKYLGALMPLLDKAILNLGLDTSNDLIKVEIAACGWHEPDGILAGLVLRAEGKEEIVCLDLCVDTEEKLEELSELVIRCYADRYKNVKIKESLN